MIQHLEEALCHSYTLKLNSKAAKAKADSILEENRRYPLGKAVKRAKQSGLFSDALQNELGDFVLERNWLVHKCVPHNLDDMYVTFSRDKLFNRIKAISNRAQTLQQTIEDDMVEFCESAGKDMSGVRAEISGLRKS